MDREAKIHAIESSFAIFIRRYRRKINELQGDTLTGHEFLFLKFLYKHHQGTASKIAKTFEVSPSYATTVIDKLIRSGYVMRRRSESDRRIVRLSVTDQGAALYQKLNAVRKEYVRQIFCELSDEELNQLVQLITRLI